MNKQKKNREAFTVERTHGRTDKSSNCFNNYTTNTVDLSRVEPYATIWKAIEFGEENAIHSAELEQLADIETRPLRKCIEQLRRNGHIIAATEKGYFRPKTQEELERYIRQEESRAESLLCTIETARKLYTSLYGGLR